MRPRFHHAASLSHSETGEDRWGGPLGGLFELGEASAAAGEEYLAADVAVAPLRIAGIGAQPDLIYA